MTSGTASRYAAEKTNYNLKRLNINPFVNNKFYTKKR